MRIPIDQIGPEGLQMDESLTESWLVDLVGGDRVYTVGGTGHLRARLQRVEDTVHVAGEASVALQAACVRCLEPAAVELVVPLELALVPRTALPAAGEDGELETADLGVGSHDGHLVDLEACVRDELLLALPQRPLCRADCAGLCDRCGHNRNAGPCACLPEVDLRWQALQQMRNTLD